MAASSCLSSICCGLSQTAHLARCRESRRSLGSEVDVLEPVATARLILRPGRAVRGVKDERRALATKMHPEAEAQSSLRL